MIIRPIEPSDWPFFWPMLESVFRLGDTYAFSPNISEGEAYRVWVEEPHETYVALEEGDDRILGTYYIKPNQPTLGAHVCNCGYVVATTARGRGIATAMCIHSQQEAKQLGFIAMQFNLVVSTNISAIRLWQKLGFEIIGTLPKAFRHSAVGFVDALVMYKTLQ